MILPLALLLLTSPAQPSAAPAALWLGRSAELALACVHKEYPNNDWRDGGHYEGGHWLGTFAVYLETGRGLQRTFTRAK
jgi:hypothetical protein